MYVNLQSINIRTSGENNQFVRFSMVNNNMLKNNNTYPTWYVISLNELPLVIECLNGTSSFYPFFDDGIHKIQFRPYGITGLEINPPRGEYEYFTFPGNWIVPYLLTIQDNPNQAYEFDLTEYIYQVKCLYAPRIKWELANYDGFYNVPYTVKQSLKHNLNVPRFKHGLSTLVRIAKNYSNGTPTTIHLSFDSLPKIGINQPDDYYWYIMTSDNHQVMNGGLIYHPSYKDNSPDYSNGEYSIHT